ncbi:hypothetical protein JHW43_001779 [Diplocarpon mali]|nr:hypothetical protein JHW43_001779 [Diplocarpon mali]
MVFFSCPSDSGNSDEGSEVLTLPKSQQLSIATAPQFSFDLQPGEDKAQILVGLRDSGQRSFYPHAALVLKKAPFLSGMLARQLETSHIATLPNDDPDTFERFTRWLYDPDSLRSVEEKSFIEDFPSLYILAERYHIQALADNVMDAFVARLRVSSETISMDWIQQAYENTKSSSKVRLLGIRCYVYTLVEYRALEEFDAEALVPKGPKSREIMADILRLIRAICACDYHQHTEEEECPNLTGRLITGSWTSLSIEGRESEEPVED